MDEKLKETPQEAQTEIASTRLPSILRSFRGKPRLIVEIVGIILILSLSTSLSGKISKDDYESLKNNYESLQIDHETLEGKYNSLQTKYNQTTSDLESAKTTLNDTLSAYAEYQTRMQPFDSLTDEELNTVASRITQTLEEKQAEVQAAAQAQAEAQQQVQGSMVWIPRSGSKYHSRSSCSNMKGPTQVTLSQAQASGYEPCKKCY